MKVEIEVPPPPKGHVVDGYRTARIYEHILCNGVWSVSTWDTVGDYLVAVKEVPIWEPPKAWGELFRGWLTRENGELWIHEDEPVFEDGEWMSEGEVFEIGLIQPNMQIPLSIPDEKCCFKLRE